MPKGIGYRDAKDYGVVAENKRPAASKAPHAYAMRTTPSTWKVDGKVVAPGSNVNGGNMNGGGKHRPGSRTVR